jgi:hypothetical protein
MIMTDACAQVARGVARDLNNMRRPSISIDQISNRLADYLDDDCMTLSPAMLRAYALEIASHPSIRTAIRP